MENDLIHIVSVLIFLGSGVLLINTFEKSSDAMNEMKQYKQRHEKYMNGEIDNL